MLAVAGETPHSCPSVQKASSVLVSLIVLLSFHGFQVDGKVDRYAFNIVENGTSVNEQVEVDVENQTEVIRVPQHNNVDAVEIMNDFDAGLSARRLPASKDCYVSKLDSSVPSPAKLKLDMEQASKQSLPDKVTTKTTGWSVVGFADRLDLPKKILDFCGSLPIYNVEAVPLDSMNTSLYRASSHGRKKRHHWYRDYTGCSHKDGPMMARCLKKVGIFRLTFNCKYDTIYCYYKAVCKHVSRNGLNPLNDYLCTGISHDLNVLGVCCSVTC
ncbi:hypothetical protein OS493_023900 [Desmophyllum pertusum]|uniref:BRICHOS domain-containing protein n=1 Tax=Desmophyllum pertusum TaxID=174260 RepID=A0A9W9YAF0_9CNID|nr:hypothetical protein OS493_023900 [Desmophyllum pertusum]